MDIYPQDLHTPLYAQVLRSRLWGRRTEIDVTHAVDLHHRWSKEARQSNKAADALSVPGAPKRAPGPDLDRRRARRRFGLFRSPFARNPHPEGSSAHYLDALLDVVAARNKRILILAPFVSWLLFPFLCMTSAKGDLWSSHYIAWILLGVPVLIRVASVHFDPFLPSSSVTAWHRPVYPSELTGILTLSDPLTGAYLELLRIITAMPNVEVADGDALRHAIQSLGATIWRLFETLPSEHDVRADKDYPDYLRRVAARFTDEAQAELDPVVAASLRRQADSASSRIALAKRQAPTFHRIQVLRREIIGHIETLCTRCEVYVPGDTSFAEDIDALMATIKVVATNAGHIAATRDEAAERGPEEWEARAELREEPQQLGAGV
jgi:hypothetical protein